MTARIDSILFQTTDWTALPVTEYPGKTGKAHWRTIQYGTLRIRVIEYSENYKADHWCGMGHILYCLEGEMTVELSNGQVLRISKGMSYLPFGGANFQHTYSEFGVKIIIIDGGSLKTHKPNVNPWRM